MTAKTWFLGNKDDNHKNYDINNTGDSNCDAGKDDNNANTIHTHQLTAKAIIMMSAPYN